MTESMWAATLLWTAILVYAVGASFDFGAGFWGWWESRRGMRQAAWVAERYVSPLWEVTNVFLVLIPVALVGFFPGAAYAYGVLLLVPGSLILILLAVRGTFLVYGHTSEIHRRRTEVAAAWTGLLIPALLVLTLPVSQGLGVKGGGAGALWLDLPELLASPATHGFLVFGLTSELFLSALLLADLARVSGADSAFARYRRRALVLGPVMFIAAAGVWGLLPPSQTWIHARLLQQWPWFAASLACFFGVGLLLGVYSKEVKTQTTASGFSSVQEEAPQAEQRGPGTPSEPATASTGWKAWRHPVRWAVVLAVLQYAFAHWGYGLSHLPFLLAPSLTVEGAFAGPAMFRTLLVVLLVGLALLFPAFVWFWRLFMERPEPAPGERFTNN
ncbi:MAG TPA: hypothetical protein GX517_10170 [Alicyclobacillus sp.]|nr:hypothetical protein [Alicyclobacillus sp.]